MKEINKFFNELYKYSTGEIEIRALPSKKQYFVEIDPEKVKEIVKRHINNNLYFSVATRDGKGGRKVNIVNIPALWVDIDFKDGVSKDDCQKRMAEFPLPPSIIVNSGRGLHVYWVLKEPGNPKDIVSMESLNRRLAVYFNGDLKATDAAHILRIPETLNYKYTPPKRVTLVKANKDEYDISEFETLLPKDPSPDCSIYNKHKQINTSNNIESVQLQHLNQMGDGDGRNDALVRIGGHFRHFVKGPGELLKTLKIFNKMFKEPLSDNEILPMWRELLRYQVEDEESLTSVILQCVKLPSKLGDIVKVLSNLGVKVNYLQVAKTLERLVKKGLVMKPRYGYYQAIENTKIGRLSDLPELGESIQFTMPLHITEFCDIYPNSLILLASREGYGKTHVFAHFINHFLSQGIPVAYWDMENEAPAVVATLKRFVPIELLDSELFSINLEDAGIETLKLSENRINFVDPIYVEGENGWARIAEIMRNLKKQLKGGLCFIAGHLKDSGGEPGTGEVMGGASARKVPSLILYLRHEKERFHPTFLVKKVRHWKSGMDVRKIGCLWDDEKGLSFLRFC